MMLDRSAILENTSFNMEPVEVPEWGGTIHVREMTAAQAEHVAKLHKQNQPAQTLAYIASICACSEDGSLVFQPADMARLAKQPLRILRSISDVATRISGLDTEDENQKKEG